jgi:hypothetical protein
VVGVQVGGTQRHVGGSEGHLLALDLPDALTRADRLIVDCDAALFPVGLGPFRVDRVREGRAGAGNLGTASGYDRGCSKNARCRDDATNLHVQFSLCAGNVLPCPTRRMGL